MPWELTPARIQRLCDPHFGVGSDGCCCSRAARTRTSSPSCGSSIRTAPRPSSRATGRARRSSTCAGTAGPTRTRSRSDRRRADHADDHLGADLLGRRWGAPRPSRRTSPRAGPTARGTLERRRAASGSSSTSRSATRSARSRLPSEARGARPGGDRARRSKARAVPEPHQRLVPQRRRQPRAGADLRARSGGDALLGDRRLRRRGDRLPARRRRARSRSSSTAASSRSRSPSDLDVRLSGWAEPVCVGRAVAGAARSALADR